jgi:hypothetical protein
MDVSKLTAPTRSAADILAAEKPKARRKSVSLEGVEGSLVDRRNYRGNGHWKFDEDMGKSKATGFIYVIRNLNSGRLYLGKKQYKGAGKLNKGQESNWPWYISSSKELSEDVKAAGKEGFEFICIEEYVSKGALSWAETFSLCYVKAPEKRDRWYNVLINKVSWNVREGITERHMERLNKVIEGTL